MFAKWWYQPNGQLDVFRRAIGGLMLLFGLLHLMYLFPPYYVPTWQFGTNLLFLPITPKWFDCIAYAAFYLSALLLLFGYKKKWPVALAVAVYVYYGSREIGVVTSNFQIVLLTYLVALLFAREPRSCWRRLVQISFSCFYGFSAINRLHPEFTSGRTISEILLNGWGVRSIWLPFIDSLTIGPQIIQAFTILVPSLMMFFALGVWFKRTRKFALSGAFLFQLLLSTFLANVDHATLVLWTGELAFFDSKQDRALREELPLPSRRSEMIVASALAALFMYMPLRFQLPNERTYADMAADLLPWSFLSSTFRLELEPIRVTYIGADGMANTTSIQIPLRSSYTDRELLSLIRYLSDQHPEAQRIELRAVVIVNSHWRQEKIITSDGAMKNRSYRLVVTDSRSGLPLIPTR